MKDKDKTTLTDVQLCLFYYKDNNVFDKYARNLSNNVVLDNDVLDVGLEDKIYIIPYKKYNKLRQWDVNKDSRNSRQRVANKKLLDKVRDLEEQIYELEVLTGLRQKKNLITKFDLMYSHEKVQEYKKQGKYVAGVLPDAEEIYRRYFVYKNGVESLIDSIYEMKVNNEDYRAIVNVVTKSLANIQKGEKTESVYKED